MAHEHLKNADLDGNVQNFLEIEKYAKCCFVRNITQSKLINIFFCVHHIVNITEEVFWSLIFFLSL